MSLLELSFASGEASLSVRRFVVQEALSALFTVSIEARSESPALDLDALVGFPATFRMATGAVLGTRPPSHDGGSCPQTPGLRIWSGVCANVAQVQVEPTGLSTYELRIVPVLWMLTQPCPTSSPRSSASGGSSTCSGSTARAIPSSSTGSSMARATMPS